ncbi:D-alanyl-D-alanine carboxypeptidase DacC [Sideroxyarcus emersonii]|uniref:D-alanyl-D-alanine carboxypeptidase DacC n=1 Tax=Sideroxyarcus emersonii TaxID=2764705 RepID=A0AAN2BXU2_9PROT|nr:D-alanyl-D-alanine carboxypeptidase/D-alanyl-D-alanine-endopeptidase [Sideroxyarcus emersonii]BCK86391.1 D-alanyl-D-alanine carboxypeptidase DacC [Sideroxyarcus emersonii]
MKFLHTAFLLCCAAATQAAPLPATVRQELKKAHIPASGIAVEVREAGRHKPLISINAQRPMNPASTMKLLTTFAALDLLGPAYTWKTEAYIDGELKDGVLNGNLILKGYGDPKFTIEQFWLWLGELRARGLRDIRGDLILDRSYFNLPPYNPGDFDADPMRAYNVGPDALLINFNTMRLRYMPEGNNLKVVSEPPLDGVTLDNQLTPKSDQINCDNWDDRFSVQPSGDSVVLQGDYPIGCGEREQNLSVMPHTRYVGALFGAVWKELGGTLQGKERDGIVGSNAQLFSIHRSEPLSTIIRDINKFSNNVMARQLFLTLGEAGPALEDETGASASGLNGHPLSIERSILTLQTWLARNRLDFRELVLENGAGLSRKERISVAHMAQLLQHAYDHPLSAELQASLPILGVDGSVKKRLKESPAASHAHLKTGTLEGVKTIAGYVRSKSGREWIVVFYINHPYAKSGQDAQDALLEWVAGK